MLRIDVIVAAQCALVTLARHTLEPREGVLHCAGQSKGAFDEYSKFMAPHAQPGISMVYYELSTFNKAGTGSGWAMNVLANLGNDASHQVLPQIGLALPQGSELAKVGWGYYDVAIGELTRGLKALGRPAYVRVGYEFNGDWNNYPADSYKAAYRRIVAPWKADHELAKAVASIWDFSCDSSGGRRTASNWYPGDDVVDWWGVNIFSGDSSANSPCVLGFVAEAQSRGYPVSLGESTPRFRGVLNSPGYQLKSGNLCLDVNNGSPNRGERVIMWRCDSHASTGNWHEISDGTLQNGVGLCLAVAGQGTSAGTPAITWDCGSGPGNEDKVWRRRGAALVNGQGACLRASTALAGDVTVGSCNGAAEEQWQWLNVGRSDGQATWDSWFKPYFTLMEKPAVKMACYINWNWRDWSNHADHSWWDWGDCRIERADASIVGRKWRASMSAAGVINALPASELCDRLGCDVEKSLIV
eukprot:TRINITY_DN56556_c0_g1_i1.p1 TRINITY_DN56556_c0_g1~~TRINITY_DN56556_c0_g1_i1.p1  ORF type:complete len:471 (+),score=67.69 TRINITY_DN56556_c0_g1_i1:88-1500(+)